MGAHQNPVQRTVVLVLAMVCTLLNGAFNTLVCVTVHISLLLQSEFSGSMRKKMKSIQTPRHSIAF